MLTLIHGDFTKTIARERIQIAAKNYIGLALIWSRAKTLTLKRQIRLKSVSRMDPEKVNPRAAKSP